MKSPIKLIRHPLYPLQTAPTPTSGIPPQSSERDRQSVPFIGAMSMITPQQEDPSKNPSDPREEFLRTKS